MLSPAIVFLTHMHKVKVGLCGGVSEHIATHTLSIPEKLSGILISYWNEKINNCMKVIQYPTSIHPCCPT